MLHSVRARLTIWYTAILALMLTIFSAVSYVLLAREIRADTDASLAATTQELVAAWNPADRLRGHDVLGSFRYNDREVLIFSSNGQLAGESKAAIGTAERGRIANWVRSGGKGFHTITGGDEGDGVRIVATPINVSGSHYTCVVARDLDEQADRLESAAHAVFLGIPIALIVAAAGGYLLARNSLAPVTRMSMKARQIGAETLGERIEIGDERDELGYLAATLNGLLERLQLAFESQRRFMADASHELRTPIAIIQGEADVALARSDRSAADYRESIEVMHRAARKLTRIVQNLFLLARGDAGGYPISMSRFYLGEVAGDCVRGMRSVASARDIEITCSTGEDTVVVADEELIHRLILNLVENAVKFTPDGGKVEVTVEADENVITIRVSDTGPGVTATDRAHIFERFFRGDRTPPQEGGAGLGLPIASWIVGVHGGKVRLERSDQDGSVFVAELPRGGEQL